MQLGMIGLGRGPAGPRERRFSAMRAFEAFLVRNLPGAHPDDGNLQWRPAQRAPMHAIAPLAAREVVDLDRFHRVGKLEAKHLRIEVELAVDRALDVLGDAKAVLLAFEGHIGDR